MSDERRIEIPIPLVAPFGIQLTAGGVQDVWNTFVKPQQERGEIQSIEDRMLMAILRAVHKGLSDLEVGDTNT